MAKKSKLHKFQAHITEKRQGSTSNIKPFKNYHVIFNSSPGRSYRYVKDKNARKKISFCEDFLNAYYLFFPLKYMQATKQFCT